MSVIREIKKIKYLLKGVGTYLPDGLNIRLPRHQQQFYRKKSVREGPMSARACYSLWLRHLVALHDNGFSTDFNAVAEVGPGDSLGVGVCSFIDRRGQILRPGHGKNGFLTRRIRKYLKS